jgi:type IV pilus assembly protein PilV
MLNRQTSSGFTLIEVMIAVVILAIGLLGMGALMVSSMQSSESAYSRSQATVLSYDIADRMRANKVLDPSKPGQSFKVPHGAISNDYVLAKLADCPAANAGSPTGTGQSKAQADLGAWCARVSNSMPNMQATSNITRNGSRYQINLSWTEPFADTGIGSMTVEFEL